MLYLCHVPLLCSFVAIRAYCRTSGHAEPEVFHTNEGHAGFLGVERIRELVSDPGLSFDDD